MNHSQRNKGGVEEKKEEDDMDHSPPLRQSQSQSQKAAADTMDKDGDDKTSLGASIEYFAKTVFGSCGVAIEAASHMVQGQCRWAGSNASPTQKQGKPALSIAEELQRLAIKEGRQYQPPPVSQERTAGIPKFLGEDAVYSFEDDNISAISQHTLEEMVARNGALRPVCRKPSNNSVHTPPSPTRTTSLSTSSSTDKHRRSRQKDERSV